MKSSSTALRGGWQYLRSIDSLVVLVAFCRCTAHLATVKTQPARLPTGLRAEEPLDSATKDLMTAEHEQPSIALRHDLLAAKISYGVLERHPKNESARSIYNFAVARVVHEHDRTDLEPWSMSAKKMKIIVDRSVKTVKNPLMPRESDMKKRLPDAPLNLIWQ